MITGIYCLMQLHRAETYTCVCANKLLVFTGTYVNKQLLLFHITLLQLVRQRITSIQLERQPTYTNKQTNNMSKNSICGERVRASLLHNRNHIKQQQRFGCVTDIASSVANYITKSISLVIIASGNWCIQRTYIHLYQVRQIYGFVYRRPPGINEIELFLKRYKINCCLE